jgi:hypothetical protein
LIRFVRGGVRAAADHAAPCAACRQFFPRASRSLRCVLVAQAQLDDLKLVSNDPALDDFDIDRFW